MTGPFRQSQSVVGIKGTEHNLADSPAHYSGLLRVPTALDVFSRWPQIIRFPLLSIAAAGLRHSRAPTNSPPSCKPPRLFHKLFRLGFHPFLQSLFLGNALFGSVFADVSVIFIEQKCGPHMEQKCAVLAPSCGRVSSWNSRAVTGSRLKVELVFPAEFERALLSACHGIARRGWPLARSAAWAAIL